MPSETPKTFDQAIRAKHCSAARWDGRISISCTVRSLAQEFYDYCRENNIPAQLLTVSADEYQRRKDLRDDQMGGVSGPHYVVVSNDPWD